MQSTTKLGLGWVPDLPDIRDYTVENEEISRMLESTSAADALGQESSARRARKGAGKKASAGLPSSVDLREYCSPIENQGEIGSCTAHAAIGLVEYYIRKASSQDLDISRLFLYKVTRNLLGWTGDGRRKHRPPLGVAS